MRARHVASSVEYARIDDFILYRSVDVMSDKV